MIGRPFDKHPFHWAKSRLDQEADELKKGMPVSDIILEKLIAAAGPEQKALGVLFEYVVKQACLSIPQPGDRVIDIGANKGVHTISLAQRVGPRGSVIAVEPLPSMMELLKTRLDQYCLTNVAFLQNAIGQEPGTTQFHHFEKYPAYSGLQQRKTPFSETEGKLTKISVEQIRLDHVIRQYGAPSFLKLDIEGGEFHALKSGEAGLKSARPVIVFENGRQSSATTYGYSKEDFFALFNSLEMDIFSVTGKALTEDQWMVPHRCWEYVALPRERRHEIARFEAWCCVAVEELKAVGMESLIAQ